MSDLQLVSPHEYIRQAATAAQKAKKRIYVLSLVVADHNETHALIAELEAAARRGVKVIIAADVFTYGEVGGGFFPVRYFSHGARHMNQLVKNLKKAGVQFHWLGRGRITLYHGRTHTKWCIIDDTVFSFGGVNLYDGGIQNVDYMFTLKNSLLADRLVQEQERIQKAERTSTNFPSSMYEQDALTVLIDGGIIGQSIIYRRAIELTEKATHITFVSQYCPTGKMARLFKKKSVDVYYNRPWQADGINRFALAIGQFLAGLKTQYAGGRYLHAKCIIFTFSDGSKVALTGSHNFAYTGVLLGTREVALETHDPAVIQQIEDFIQREVAAANKEH